MPLASSPSCRRRLEVAERGGGWVAAVAWAVADDAAADGHDDGHGRQPVPIISDAGAVVCQTPVLCRPRARTATDTEAVRAREEAQRRLVMANGRPMRLSSAAVANISHHCRCCDDDALAVAAV